jgi:hypothetical protein
VNPVELVLGVGLAGLLVGVAIYYAWRQRRVTRQVRFDSDLSLEDRRFLHRQTIRRITCSVLMIGLAAMLVGWFFLEPDLRAIRPVAEGAKMTDDERESLQFITAYVIFALFLFMAIMVLALLDVMATARFARRHQRQLEQNRREVLAAEVSRMRQQRHELN